MFRKAKAMVIRFLLVSGIGFNTGTIVFLGIRYSGLGLLFLVGVIACMCRQRPRALWAHGTARLADFADLFNHGMLGGQHGLVLGRAGYIPPPSKSDAIRALLSLRWPSFSALYLFSAAFGLGSGYARSLIRLPKFQNLVTFAPTGAGKSVSVLIPALQNYVYSCVVVDPKGELWNATAGHRRRKFSSRCVRLDPFEICGPGGLRFNPLAFLDRRSPDFIYECRSIANMLVVRTGKETENHWNDMAEVVITCMIALVASADEPCHRHLQAVCDILASPDCYAKAIAVMGEFPHLARIGVRLLWLRDRELGSVMATVQRQVAWMDGSRMAEHVTGESFDPLDLRSCESVTLYLILPPDQLITLAPLLRLWVGFLLKRSTKAGANETNPLLFLIDEAGHLGHMQALEDAVTLMRGYGIRLWFFFQSIGQLSKAFGDRASVFLDNIDTQQYFCINAIDSADVISRMVGDATIFTQSSQRGWSYSHPTGGANQGQGGQYSTSGSVTVSEMARRLFKPEEIRRLPADMALVFHKNLPVIPVKLVVSYADRDFKSGGSGYVFRPGTGLLLLAVLASALGVMGLKAAASLPAASETRMIHPSPAIDTEPPSHSAAARRRQRRYVPPADGPYQPSGFNPWFPETW